MMTMPLAQIKRDDSPCPSFKVSKTPHLKTRRIGIVSRNYWCKFGGKMDFCSVLKDVLKLLDENKCDTILFSLWTIIRGCPVKKFLNTMDLKHVKAVLYEEFVVKTKPSNAQKQGKLPVKSGSTRYIVCYRKSGEWREFTTRQILGSLSPSKKDKEAAKKAGKTVKESMNAKIDCLLKEMPRRVLGNCCLILCGESNAVNYSRADRKVHDRFGIRKAIPSSVGVIFNPIHDRMTRPEMKHKRCFLSGKERWVISVWNKGKKFNGKTRDGSGPPWMIFHNGKDKTGNVRRLDKDLNIMNVEIGMLDIETA